MSVLPRVMEKDRLGRMYIRRGRVLTLSIWLYETGAILGRLFKNRLWTLVSIFETESKRKKFTEFWRSEARKRLDTYGARPPRSFAIFIGRTDLAMFDGVQLHDMVKIGDRRLFHKEGQRYLTLAEKSMIEGIMFGSMFPDLTYEMLKNQYEEHAIDSWKQARKYGVTLSEEPPHTTVGDRDKEAVAMLHDYLAEYHPELMHELSLTKA